jgi:hypothetical protein
MAKTPKTGYTRLAGPDIFGIVFALVRSNPPKRRREGRIYPAALAADNFPEFPRHSIRRLLKTGETRPHDPGDYATKITVAAPDGECPLFLTFSGDRLRWR